MNSAYQKKLPPIWLFIVAFSAVYVALSSGLTTIFRLPWQVPISPVVRWGLGLPVLVLGGVLLIWAFKSLSLKRAFGKELFASKSESTLITHGIYAHTRNPLYLSVSLLLLGWFLVLRSTPLGFLTICFFVHFLFVAKWEEGELRERFGTEYEDYRNRVPLLLPRGCVLWFGSTDAFGDRKRATVSITILLLWLVGVICVALRHEMWRDEVRALSIALEPAWFWQLPVTLRNEGHPVLWYWLLRAAHVVCRTPWVLSLVSIGVAFAGVFLFFRFSPFSLWQKVLFLAGIFPAYEYSVMCRNYGISMLLFFLFAALYARRQKWPLVLGIVIAALANTNAHSCLLAVLLCGLWFWDEGVAGWRSLDRRRVSVLACAWIVASAGIMGAVVTCLPEKDTIVTGVYSINVSDVMEAIGTNIRHPGHYFGEMFMDLPIVYRDAILWLLIAGLLVEWTAALLLLVGNVSMGVFFATIFPSELRHEGVFMMFLVALYWIVHDRISSPSALKGKRWLRLLHDAVFHVGLPILLVIQIVLAVPAIRKDLFCRMSSSRDLARYIEQHVECRNAILMGEPDYRLESMPYYVTNRIYIPRESKFRDYVQFTEANRQRLSLREFLNIARQIQEREKSTVLLVLGHLDLAGRQEFREVFSYDKVFTWSPEELMEFSAVTIKKAEFTSALTDENYEIYVLR